MNEKHCVDLLAGYALEILDGEDRLTAEEHLQLCTECREEMEALRETLHFSLGQLTPPAQPDPLVRTRLLAQFALEARPVVEPLADVLSNAALPVASTQGSASLAVLQGGTEVSPIPVRQRLIWLVGGALLPAVAAAVFCILFLHTQAELNTQKNNALAAAINSPHSTMHLTGIAVNAGMNGEVLMQHDSGTGMLIISGIHHVPNGMTYTCWVHKHGQWLETGTLQPDASGMAMIPFIGSSSLDGADAVAVTIEHSAVPSTPAGHMLLTTSI